MKHAISAALSAVLLAGAAGAQPIPIDDFAKEPSITSLSMSPEGDFIVGLVSKPGSDNEELALAVWDIDGEIDTTKVLLPNRITPGNKRARFFQADAIGQMPQALQDAAQQSTDPLAEVAQFLRGTCRHLVAVPADWQGLGLRSGHGMRASIVELLTRGLAMRDHAARPVVTRCMPTDQARSRTVRNSIFLS
jgi:hypothetical protein